MQIDQGQTEVLTTKSCVTLLFLWQHISNFEVLHEEEQVNNGHKPINKNNYRRISTRLSSEILYKQIEPTLKFGTPNKVLNYYRLLLT